MFEDYAEMETRRNPDKIKPKPPLDVTWSIMDREPGMDDLMEQAGDSLNKMGEDLKIYPFQDGDQKDRLFLARFEFPKFEEELQFSIEDAEGALGFIHFLTGFPIDCVEMLVAIGEYSSKEVSVQGGNGKVHAPVPTKGNGFFQWPENDKILLNLTAIAARNIARFIAPNLEGEPKPAKAHWWFQFLLLETSPLKLPVPGEFLGLGVRMMPDMYWGHQLSSPFLYSGNWMDTVYYTGARITEVIDPTGEVPYPTYKVRWRKDEVTAKPTDFAEYEVGDRVTILKDVATTKKSQLWKDGDMKEFGETWMIAPITFYGLEGG